MTGSRRQDRIFGLAVALAAAAFLLVLVPGIEVPVETAGASGEFRMGPRFFPYLAGGLCLVLGLTLAALPAPSSASAGPSAATRTGLPNVAVFMAVAVAYPLVWEPLGFVLATALALLLLLLLFGMRSVFVIVGVIVLVPLSLAYMFQGLMGVLLPEGPLGLTF